LVVAGQPGQDAQTGRLAAAAGPQDAQKLTLAHAEAHVAQRLDALDAPVRAFAHEGLANLVETDDLLCHEKARSESFQWAKRRSNSLTISVSATPRMPTTITTANT